MGPNEYIARRLNPLGRMLTSPEATRDLLTHLGQQAKGDVRQGVIPDVGGDGQMSNWPRRSKRAPALGARYDLVDATTMHVKPDGPSAGPFAMLEDGRKVRRVGQFASKGRGRGKGGSYTRLRVVTRAVGPMAPKGTWSDAAEKVESNFRPRLLRWKDARLARAMRG